MTEPEATIFISYAHADRPLAEALATGLTRHGFRVWIDQGELRVGDSLVDRISDALDRVDFVAVLVSEASVGSNWCQKEISLAMTGEINRLGIRVLPLRIDGSPMPVTIKDKLYLDIERENIAAAVNRLVTDIRRHLNPPPPLPDRRPRTARPRVTDMAPSVDPVAPVTLTGIDIDHVSSPRGDGTRGSGLYAVPFTLSHTPDSRWANLLVDNWNHPPQFGTMHRPGIARVVGDRILLDGTTIEEVANHHRTTLTLAVAATNDQHQALLGQDRRRQEAAHRQADDHRQRVQDTARRLTFD